MTLEEYAREISRELRDAYNSKNAGTIQAVFEDADKALNNGSISANSQTKFWADVRAQFEGGDLLLEKQANSSLVALMRAIEQQLAARAKQLP